MKPLTVGDLQDLIRPRKGPCVSIFLPTHRRPDGAREDRLRFKNLLDDAQRRLESVEGRRGAAKLLAPLAPLSETAFWRDQLDGLAVFSDAAGSRHWRLPIDLPERVVVADSYHVRPLLRYLQSNLRFYVLALSRNGASFYEGTASSLTPKSVDGMPRSLEDAVGGPTEREGLSSHSAGHGNVMFHGAGASRSEREDFSRYFRAVDQSIRALLRDEHAPLVLAGVTRYHAIFRSVSRYPHLAPEGVEGNYERARPEDLHARVAPLAGRLLRAGEDAAVAEYHRVHGSGLSTDDLVSVGEASVQGRVRRLMIARGRLVKGLLDRATGAIRRKGAGRDRVGDDVLDDLAESVLVRGGEVMTLEKDRMPSRSPVAAVLRW